MHPELTAVVEFVQRHSSGAPAAQQLTSALAIRYAGHWYPSDPERGSAFRALHQGDPVLPAELDIGSRWTIFVDPGSVAYKTFEDHRESGLHEIYRSSQPFVPATDRAPPASPTKRTRALPIRAPEARLTFAPSLFVDPPTPVPAFTAVPATIPATPSRAPSPSSLVDALVQRTHSRSSSTASDVSTASTTLSSLFDRKPKPAHRRSDSSVSTSTTTSIGSSHKPVEHSNGKVGVLGGGVLLGVPSVPLSSSSEDSSENDDEGPLMVVTDELNGQGKRRRSRNRNRPASAFKQWSKQVQWAQDVFATASPVSQSLC